MAQSKWTMMTDFSMALPDRPGELARLAARLRAADVNLLGLWGYGPGTGSATFHCVPDSADQFRDFALSADLQITEGRTFFLSGEDRGGALIGTLETIASAGISLHAIEAVTVQGKFGCFIWTDDRDWPALEKLLS